MTGTTNHGDNVYSQWGTGTDFWMVHNGANTLFQNESGDLIISNNANNQDIQFKSDDGAGNQTLYYYLDGSIVRNRFPKDVYLEDDVKLLFGDATTPDLEIYHDASHSFISEQGTGSLITLATDYQLNNSANTQNMITASDGGAVTLYTAGVGKLATNSTGVAVTGNVELPDDGQLQLGNLASGDLKLYHDGTDSIIVNKTGDLKIMNQANDKDIILMSDDGAGGDAAYMTIDGGVELTRFAKGANFGDNVKLSFGDVTVPGDLEIYHDTSNSYIRETGTGNMYIQASERIRFTGINNEALLYLNENSNVEAYYNNALKLETTATGTKTTGQMDIAALNTAPANATDTGTLGEIRYTADYIYVCVATDTWKRSAISTW